MACHSCLLMHFSQIELRDDGFGARRAVVIACRAESAASSQDIRVGDEIISIMVMGKNCEYDGLDLIELLSEDFEVTLHAHVFAACSRLIASTAQPAYDRIMHTLHGCSGTLVSPIAAFSIMLPSIFKQLLELISLRGTRARAPFLTWRTGRSIYHARGAARRPCLSLPRRLDRRGCSARA